MATHWPNYRPLGFRSETDEEDGLAYSLQRLFCTDTQPNSSDNDPIPRSEAGSSSIASGWLTGRGPAEWLILGSDKRH